MSPEPERPKVTVHPPTVKLSNDPRGKQATWTLIDQTPAGTCSQCAVTHEPDEPHNAQSVHYQYKFYAEHDRWPNWGDAMSHCTPEVQEAWRSALRQRGVAEEELHVQDKAT